MTKTTKSSQGATPRPLREFDLAHTLGSINSLHKQQFKWRHGGESPPPARREAPIGAPWRVEAPIEKADAATLKKDAEAAAAARAAAAVRVAAAEKMRKQVAAKAAQAKGGGDAAGPSSPAA